MEDINNQLRNFPDLIFKDEVRTQILNDKDELIPEVKGRRKELYVGFCSHCGRAPCINYSYLPEYNTYKKMWWKYERQTYELDETIDNSDDDGDDIIPYSDRVKYNDFFIYPYVEYDGIKNAYKLYVKKRIYDTMNNETMLYNDVINIILQYV